MAGAGFKTFGVGDVLTASDVNTYLMQQAVMNFASSGARGSAIGTATEGMVSYLADTDTVEVYDGSAWTAVGSDPNPGIGTNVVQTVKTDTFSSASSKTWVAVTGLTATITPSSATSKVLVIAHIPVSNTTGAAEGVAMRLSGGNSSTFVGDAASNRVRGVTFFLAGAQYNPVSSNIQQQAVFLDSPATTSATTYGVEIYNVGTSGTIYVNRSSTDTDSAAFIRGAASITAIEVAA